MEDEHEAEMRGDAHSQRSGLAGPPCLGEPRTGQAVTQTASRPPGVGSPSAGARLKVLLITESGFPYRFSGVSTWCKELLDGLSDVEFQVLAMVGEPDAQPIYPLPDNVTGLTTVPLWGTREVLENRPGLRFRDIRLARGSVDEEAVAERLAPALGTVLGSFLSEGADAVALADCIRDLHRFFLTADFDSSLRTEVVWSTFLTAAREQYPAAAQRAGYRRAPLALSDVVTGMHWLHHWMMPIAGPLPDVDVAHATMAGACTLPAVAMKLHQGCGFVFSEHGIYLRETYLREAPDRGSLFLKLLKVGFARRMSEVSYALADEISSCCEYNRRWESRVGAVPDRVSTVYYGLDPNSFAPVEASGGSTPVVLWMGRIDPLKDLETLLRAASIVHAARDEVIFRLHGTAAPDSEAYRDRMLALRHELGLDDVVEFAGYTSDPRRAYSEADIVVLSSISEGFPYSTLEAMLCAKPVVATSVGGVGEQVGDCGLQVEPRDPTALAAAMLGLLDDPERAREMGQAARQRAQELFNVHTQNRLHLDLYRSAIDSGPSAPAIGQRPTNGAGPVSTVPDGAPLDELVDRVRSSVPHPVDDLEIAAVVEAGGVSDAVAGARYGAPDAFALGREVLARLRAGGQLAAPRPHEIDPPQRERQPIPEPGRGVLLLFPAAVVLLAGHFLIKVPGWTSGTGQALMLGVTTSMVLTNAFMFGIVRRSSLFIGCGRWDAARRFLWRTSWLAALCLLGAEAIGLLVAQAGNFTGSELTTFALSFSALAVFWIACGGLILINRAHEAGMAVVLGLGIGVLTDQVVVASIPRHLEIAILVAYVATVAIIGGRVVTALRRKTGAPNGYRHPTGAYVLREALPYFSYGGLLIALILAPNLLTAFVTTSASTTVTDLSSVEVGMTLALIPLMVSLYAADAGLHRFWVSTCRALSDTPVDDAPGFGSRLLSTQRSFRRRYLTGVLVISLVSVPVLWALADNGSLHALGVHATGLLMWSFVVSLLSYVLLASGQFDSAIPLGFASPRLALRSLAGGFLAAAIVAAVIFALGDPEAGFVSMFVGSCVFAASANVCNRAFFRRLDFHYVRSM
jgi:glycosyltransferase involved in cell wall biosynthesis